MRVLIVEDCYEIRENLAGFLRKKGYVVDTAADGLMGLHRACDFQIDLAVIDCGLPSVSGIDLIKKIRHLMLGYPIIVMTSYERWEERAEFLEAGADDYIEKPFNPNDLREKIDALGRRVGMMSPA